MQSHCISALVMLAVLIGSGCDRSSSSPPAPPHSPPTSAITPVHIDATDTTLLRLGDRERAALLRYTAGNGRWEVRHEKGKVFAIRREQVGGHYQTTLNGFYGEPFAGGYRQRRVLIAFDQPHGFGRKQGNVTRITPGITSVPLTIESDAPGTPGHASYLIVEGPRLFIEIYDQSPGKSRLFTQQSLDEVNAELRDVLNHLAEIEATGMIPLGARYPISPATVGHLHVSDGMQPGIYLIDAAINPVAAGVTYVRVYATADGHRISASEIERRTTRTAAWSIDGSQYFSYNAELTVYEGGRSTAYEARFEIWHRDDQGHEIKLAETTRMIHGWER